jgi:hypothetical protein
VARTLTTAIYAIAGELAWSKTQLYAFAAEKVGYGASVESSDPIFRGQTMQIIDPHHDYTGGVVKPGVRRVCPVTL